MNDMQPFDILVVGGANTDYMVRGPKLPGPGDAVEGEDFHTAPGGKGLNQAAAAARLGAHTALVACVGNDDRGDEAVSRLYAEGVATRFIARDAEARTGVVLVQVDLRMSRPRRMPSERPARSSPSSRCRWSAYRRRRASAVLAARWSCSIPRRRAICRTICSGWSISSSRTPVRPKRSPGSRCGSARQPVRPPIDSWRAGLARSLSRLATKAICWSGATASTGCPGCRCEAWTRRAPGMPSWRGWWCDGWKADPGRMQAVSPVRQRR